MPSIRSISLALVAIAFVGCAPEDQAGSAAAAEAAEAPAAASQELACWLRRGTLAEAQERPSPLRETIVMLGGQEAKLCYGAPSARGRAVFGELEAFGVPWRSGANEATALHLPFAATVGDIALEPGSYSIYSIPGEEEWEVVVNGAAERWGIPISDEVRAADLGSLTLARESTDMVETLTYVWEQESEDAGHLVLLWETTRVAIPVRLGGM
jgi:hypothetical protein